MSWAKRNLYFLISCVLAVGLLLAAGWYCYSSWSSNNANWDQLSAAYAQLQQYANEPIGAGNDTVTNIDAARAETQEAKVRVAAMEKFFTPLRSIPNTNRFDDRIIASAVRETVGQLRAAAQAHNVALPLQQEFAFSFTLQEGKITYDPGSWAQLSKELGEVKAICDVLYSCRIISLDAIQRERTADDINPSQGSVGPQPDYVDGGSVTNGNIVITPYEVTFECFTPELGGVLSSFANQPHTFIAKTLNIQPVDQQMGGYPEPGAMGRYGGEYGGGYGGGYGAAMPVVNPRGGLPSVIDEKKLKVILHLDIVKMVPAQGR